ncbi:MAG: hypothetical protein ABEI99_00720 [Halobaculum sp.]
MPLGRYFRGLTSFDLLGNLIPGLLTLLAVLLSLPGQPLPSGLLGYSLFVVLAFVVGSVVQAHASKAGGERTSFEKTMQAAESLPELSKTDEGPQSESEGSGRAGPFVLALLHAVVGPLFWWCLPERGERLDDAILVNTIWDDISANFDIPDNTDSIGVLYHLMSSRVDDAQSPSRAVRMQAIRNFQRGLWIAAWYSTVSILLVLVLDGNFDVGETVYGGVAYTRPAYYDYWTPLWNLLVVGVVAVVCFWSLFESFEEDYVEYLFVDYAIGTETPTRSVQFSERGTLNVGGSLSGEIVANPDSLETAVGLVAELDGRRDQAESPTGDETASDDCVDE